MHFIELPFSFHSLSPFFAPSFSLPLCPRSRAKSRSSSLTERSFQLFFTARPLCPRWDSLPHGGNALPRSCYMRASSTHALLYSWTRSMCVCVPVIKLLEIPDPFYCSFDPHPRRHEGQGGVPRYLVQVYVREKEDRERENPRDKYTEKFFCLPHTFQQTH